MCSVPLPEVSSKYITRIRIVKPTLRSYFPTALPPFVFGLLPARATGPSTPRSSSVPETVSLPACASVPVHTLTDLDALGDNAKPSKQAGGPAPWMIYDDEWVDEVKRAISACKV